MSSKRSSTILSAAQVKLHSRKLVCREQPDQAPQVILKRDGETISSIEIRCSCGEQIMLDCLYEDAVA